MGSSRDVSDWDAITGYLDTYARPCASWMDGVEPESFYLDRFLDPFKDWLADEMVLAILINRPGEVWLERIGQSWAQRVDVPEIDDEFLNRLARCVEASTRQLGRPLMAIGLPDGVRIQMVGPPVVQNHWAAALSRRHHRSLSLAQFKIPDTSGTPSAAAVATSHSLTSRLQSALRSRKTILISGVASVGRSTLLNALIRELSPAERVVLIENTPDIALPYGNNLTLRTTRQERHDTANVTANDLLQVAAGLRAGRIALDELCGPEVVSFVRSVKSGCLGSLATVRACSPSHALDQLALMVLEARLGFSWIDAVAYVRSAVDLIVQVGPQNEMGRIQEIVPSGNI